MHAKRQNWITYHSRTSQIHPSIVFYLSVCQVTDLHFQLQKMVSVRKQQITRLGCRDSVWMIVARHVCLIYILRLVLFPTGRTMVRWRLCCIAWWHEIWSWWIMFEKAMELTCEVSKFGLRTYSYFQHQRHWQESGESWIPLCWSAQWGLHVSNISFAAGLPVSI